MQITSPLFDEKEVELVRQCLESGWVTQGPRTAEFEKLVAMRHGVSHALATTSCTAALHLATLALDLKPGDEVVVPAFTWVTSANCAEYVGARVVFADVDPKTYNLDPKAFEAVITERTRAVVAVHLFGLAADMDEILAIAGPRNIAVIEDAACAIGTTYKGRPVGGLGEVGCFSFHPRKVVTTGEGGMVTTNSEALAQHIASLRNHGASPATDGDFPWSLNQFNILGHNLRLSDIQAAVGVAQMAKLEGLLEERRAAAREYNSLLRDIDELRLPAGNDMDGHTYQSYVVRVLEGGRARRNRIMAAMAEADIQTRPGTHAVHRLGYYRDKYGIDPAAFPVAASSEDETITLPIFPGMTKQQQEYVAESLLQALNLSF